MTDVIAKAIEESRDRERKATPGPWTGPHEGQGASTGSFFVDGEGLRRGLAKFYRREDAEHYRAVRSSEPRFRDALEVAMEVFALAPTECICTVKIICPHCLLKAAKTRIVAIVEGRVRT